MPKRRTNTFTRMNIELNDEEKLRRGGRAGQLGPGGDTQCCNSLDNELWKTGGFSWPFKDMAITSRQPSLLRPFAVFFFSFFFLPSRTGGHIAFLVSSILKKKCCLWGWHETANGQRYFGASRSTNPKSGVDAISREAGCVTSVGSRVVATFSPEENDVSRARVCTYPIKMRAVAIVGSLRLASFPRFNKRFTSLTDLVPSFILTSSLISARKSHDR